MPLLIVAVALSPPPSTAPASQPQPVAASAPVHIDFLESIEAAQLMGQREGKPIVVQFTAAWCGWCRRMESETFRDARLEPELDSVVWVKIDVDEQPEIGSAYGVRGLPHTVIIDQQGQALASSIGFMRADELVELMHTAVAAFEEQNPGVDNVLPDTRALVSSLVKSLASAQRAGRESAMASIDRLGPEAWPILQKLLNDDRLAVRAAAHHALTHLTGESLPFDPFGSAANRAEQAAAWGKWIDSNSSTIPPAADLPQAPPGAPQDP